MTSRHRAPRVPAPDELSFMKSFMLAIGTHPQVRIWRQNVGQIAIRDRTGKIVRMFDPGPPVGAADLSGIVVGPPSVAGLRLEIELKSATGDRSDAQIRWAEHIIAFGGVYVLLTYDASRSMAENVAAAVAAIEAAIERRRRRAA